MSKAKISAGDVFGKLTVLEIIPAAPRPARRERRCLCLCKCGRKTTPTITNLRSETRGCRICFRLEYVVPDSSFKRAFKTFKHNATKRSLEFAISFQQFKELIVKDCFYCGEGPIINSYSSECKTKVPMNSMDRRNNKIGYTPANAVPACINCQQAKWDFSEQEFINWAKRFVAFQLKKLSNCDTIQNEEKAA